MLVRPIFRSVFRKVFAGVFNRDVDQGLLQSEDGFNLLQEDGSFILL